MNKPSMLGVTIEETKEITVKEGKRYVTFIMDPLWYCTKVDTNLPYKKGIKDWKFYAKAIKEMIRALEKKV